MAGLEYVGPRPTSSQDLITKGYFEQALYTAINTLTPITHEEYTPVASVTYYHSFGRIPQVTTYTLDGIPIEGDVVADYGQVYISWPEPTQFYTIIF